MARVPYPEPASLSAEMTAFAEGLTPLNVFRMLGHSPHLMKPFVAFGRALLYRGGFDPALRELAVLRVGYRSGATYETAQHEKIGRDVGMTDEQISLARQWPDVGSPTDDERLVLAFVDDLIDHVRAGDSTLEPVLARFGSAGAAELTLLTGYYMMVCRFLETFGVDIEEGGPIGLDMGTPK